MANLGGGAEVGRQLQWRREQSKRLTGAKVMKQVSTLFSCGASCLVDGYAEESYWQAESTSVSRAAVLRSRSS